MRIGIKLILAFLLIVFVTAGIATIYSTAAISKAFQDYMQRNYSYRAELFAAAVSDYYRTNGWTGIQLFVQNGAKGRGPGMGMGSMMHNRRFGAMMDQYLVADHTGRIIADTDGSDIGRQFETELLANGQPVMVDGKLVGTVVSRHGYGQLEETFISSIRRANLVAGVTALMLSLVLGIYLSRRISRPIVALAEGANRLAERDLSYRVRVIPGDEIGEAAKSFNKMADTLEQNEKLRKNMLADVAHELRTPVTILRGNLELLQEGAVQPNAEVFASLHDETVRMTRLVTELQDLALAEAGELVLNIEPVLLADIIKNVCGRLTGEAQTRGIRLVTDVPGELLVHADARRLEQVLYNLLINALKYTGAGGTVSVIGTTEGEEAGITVEDTGTGIATEELPYIFNRFYRSDKARNRETGGTGLGLAIVKSFIEAHQGRVWAESQVGCGSRFTFTLPIHK